MAFENIKRITLVGRPTINVPASMTAEQTLTAMQIDASTYEQTIDGDNLILAAASGSKGAARVRVTEDGVLVPLGNPTFPTDADIEAITKLFPEDNLFETLENPVKLQEYFTALKENEETLAEEAKAEAVAKRSTEVDRLKAAVEAVRVYAADPEKGLSDEILLQVAFTADKLLVLLEMAVAQELVDKERAEAEAKREADLAVIREANPGFAALAEFAIED
jgi:hypothetical protein